MLNFRATHVGYLRERSYTERTYSECARCGRPRITRPDSGRPDMCRDCMSSDPLFGTIPFDQLPVSDSNEDSFDVDMPSDAAMRKRADRQRAREQQ